MTPAYSSAQHPLNRPLSYSNPEPEPAPAPRRFPRGDLLVLLATLTTLCLPAGARAAPQARASANVPVELAFTAHAEHAGPFNSVTMDVVFTDPAGVERRVPAFWAGGSTWKARHASPLTGSHRWRSECAAGADEGLHGLEGTVDVAAYEGENPFFRHGPIHVAEDRRHFEHADHTPFFWLGDTWWMGLCLMNGAAGHTYGANGIWQCNRRDQPHGPSPHGGSYGVISWDDAMRLAGSRQIGQGKAFLERFPWSRLEPHPAWAAWADTPHTPAWGGWIWFPEGDPKRDAPVATRCFRRAFDLPAGTAVRQATLSICADDQFTVWIDNRCVGSGADWHSPKRIDVGSLLTPGRHLLAVLARHALGPRQASIGLTFDGFMGVGFRLINAVPACF